MSEEKMSKQELAYAKFVEYFCKAGISHIVGAMRLYDTMRRKYDKDIYFHTSLSAKKLSDEDAELVIKVIDEEMLSTESLMELLRQMLDSYDK
ncbi:MAG TPA: hypothetical protein PKL73_03280, partial [Polyangiaceae bacterium]|nr:hypothetical protein [Polyangiaceae bacterium]HNZ22566.1 hypothetical protein [Polyangiaceae bacterium]HOE50087.1 hypothetical protein [Polyangiaceae bacterium]HOH00129.1 hypothetical protein [Polyangiaceae bacterium]HOR33965.1 hypothetical protein [Polyangiaceae bacterium]